MEQFLDLLQWPAMLVTVIAVWLVGYQDRTDRQRGFWTFLLSNFLWVVWGLHSGAYALVLLQFALAVLNIRGIVKNQRRETAAQRGAAGLHD